jgi:hypothetical protein
MVMKNHEMCGLLGNYTASCNYPADHRFHQHHGGSLRSMKNHVVIILGSDIMHSLRWIPLFGKTYCLHSEGDGGSILL